MGKSEYNSAPAPTAKQTEGKENKFDAAEYDEEFFQRFAAIDWDALRAYLEALPEAERKAIMEALNRAVGQQAVKEHHEWLRGGMW